MSTLLQQAAQHLRETRERQGAPSIAALPLDGQAYYELVIEAALEDLAAWLRKEQHVYEKEAVRTGSTEVFINDGIRARGGTRHRFWLMGDRDHGYVAAFSPAARNPNTFQDCTARHRVLGLPQSSSHLLEQLLELAGGYFRDPE